MITRFLPRNWPGLEWNIFKPFITCGQHSLEVFCGGVFLAFAGHFVLLFHHGYLMQFLVSAVGILALCGIGYFKQWTAGLDKKPPARREGRKESVTVTVPSVLTVIAHDEVM
jgi:hypothetical protein